MPNFSIKDVPAAAAAAERLRERAARNRRSLQGELLAIIEAAANEEQYLTGPSGESRPHQTTPRPRPARKTVEEIAAELRALFPESRASGGRSADIVRELRDSR